MNARQSGKEFPYKTYLNILHAPLELIDVQKLADTCTDKWYNQTLCKVNDSVVRMAVVQGEAFGAPAAFRISFALGTSALSRALQRITDAIAKLK